MGTRVVSRAKLLGWESRLELVLESESALLGGGEVCWRRNATTTAAHQSSWRPGSRERSPFPPPPRGLAVSLQRPLGTEPNLAPAGEGKCFQGPAPLSPRRANRVNLELRDNKVTADTVRSQKDGGLCEG